MCHRVVPLDATADIGSIPSIESALLQNQTYSHLRDAVCHFYFGLCCNPDLPGYVVRKEYWKQWCCDHLIKKLRRYVHWDGETVTAVAETITDHRMSFTAEQQ